MLFLASTVSQNFARNWLLMVSVSYAGENTYSAGKTSGFLMGGASTANRRSMLAHCARPPHTGTVSNIFIPYSIDLLMKTPLRNQDNNDLDQYVNKDHDI